VIYPRPLAAFGVPFWVDLGRFGPSYNNGPNDLVRDLFLSLDIVTNALPTCGPLSIFVGPLGGARMLQNSIRHYNLVVLEYFTYNNGPNDLERGVFLSLDIGTYIPPTCGPLCTILGPFGVPKCPKQHKIYIFFI
jgi:hypothetical protein